MHRLRRWQSLGLALLSLIGLFACGCQLFPGRGNYPGQQGVAFPGAPGTLGALSDPVFQNMEINAEASDFVVYDHEFIGDTVRLNYDGQDHVKQIAARMRHGSTFPVIVERSFSSPIPDDPYNFPIHPSPELDNRRRLVIVKALQVMGIQNADDFVTVAPALAWPMDHNDTRRAHRNIDTRNGYGAGGYGGMGGMGFGGLGMFGFF